jgi:hypothetical protein
MSGDRPVDIPATLAEQLQVLSRSPQPDTGALGHPSRDPRGDGARTARPADGELTAGLVRLSREVVAVVPSCVAVAIAVSRLGVDVVITVPAGGAARVHRATEVLASLALPLSAAGFGSVLVLQASAPGAFVLLADDLAALLGSGHPPPELDLHLGPLSSSTGGALADLRLLDRALGVLIGQGWAPQAAEEELRRRAAAAGLTVAEVAERLLESPQRSAGVD